MFEQVTFPGPIYRTQCHNICRIFINYLCVLGVADCIIFILECKAPSFKVNDKAFIFIFFRFRRYSFWYYCINSISVFQFSFILIPLKSKWISGDRWYFTLCLLRSSSVQFLSSLKFLRCRWNLIKNFFFFGNEILLRFRNFLKKLIWPVILPLSDGTHLSLWKNLF